MPDLRTHVALLRGINVGGHNKIKMADLRSLCESLGFDSPTTLLQSGNLVFRAEGTDPPELEALLTDGIEERFGFRCPVLVLEPGHLRRVVEGMPFDADELETKLLTVVFLDRSPTASARKTLQTACVGAETLAFGEKSLYVYYPDGIARSKFTLALRERALGATATARNWNTTNKILALTDRLEEN